MRKRYENFNFVWVDMIWDCRWIMSDIAKEKGKIPEKFDDNVVLFLCRGQNRRKVRFGKRDTVPKFQREVLYDNYLALPVAFNSSCWDLFLTSVFSPLAVAHLFSRRTFDLNNVGSNLVADILLNLKTARSTLLLEVGLTRLIQYYHFPFSLKS